MIAPFLTLDEVAQMEAAHVGFHAFGLHCERVECPPCRLFATARAYWTAQEEVARLRLKEEIVHLRAVVDAAKDHQTARRYGDAKDVQVGNDRLDRFLAALRVTETP